MALVGDCFWITYTQHQTDTTLETIEYPDGTVEEVEVPVQIENIETYNDVYLVITQVENFNTWVGEDVNDKTLFSYFRAYQSKADRNNDFDNYLFEGTVSLSFIDFNTNLYAQIYDAIKLETGLDTLQND